MLATGRSFAVYGAAGTGKSAVRDRIAQLVPAITLGPTGMCVAGTAGVTVARFLRDRHHRIAVGAHHTVIVEEVAMVGTADFVALDAVLKRRLRSRRPFGGLRVVLFGDYLQLAGPGVTRPLFTTAPYKALRAAGMVELQLTEQLRQAASEDRLAALLADCRAGRLSAASAELLQYTLCRKTPPPGALRLYATRRGAAAWNARMLAQAPGTAVCCGGVQLKAGSPVTVTENRYVGGRLILANGQTGRVVSVTATAATVEVAGTAHVLAAPPPVALAHALTVHRAQGQTYDVVVVVGTNTFLPGQVYTALSRARTLSGLFCIDVLPEHAELPWPRAVREFCRSVLPAL